MRPDSALWRVSDSVAYDIALQTAERAVASGLAPVPVAADPGGSTKSIDSRVAVLETDGFDRAAVRSLNMRDAVDRMVTDTADRDVSEVLRDRILPTVFRTAQSRDKPRFVLLGGQAG